MSKKERKKALRQHSPKKTGRMSGTLLFFIFVLAYMGYSFISKEFEKAKLAEKGIVVKAYVFTTYHGGKKGYRFQCQNLGLYDVEGKAYINDKERGDSLYVVFLPEDPWCNRPWKEVKEYKKARQRIQRAEVPEQDD